MNVGDRVRINKRAKAHGDGHLVGKTAVVEFYGPEKGVGSKLVRVRLDKPVAPSNLPVLLMKDEVEPTVLKMSKEP